MEGISKTPDPITPLSQSQSNTVDSHNTSKPPLQSKKTSRKQSDVWDHFTKNLDDPRGPSASCNYCDKCYVGAGDRKYGTSTLRTHVLNQCPNNPFKLEDKKQKTLIFQNESIGGNNLKAVAFCQSDCRTALAKMIILDELSFRFVEQEGFKLFCSVACPRLIIPSRITIGRDIMKLYNNEKKKLKDYFVKHSQRVSLHMRCSAHILNLIVGEGLKDLDNSIIAVRNAVRYVRGSPSRLARFQNCVKSVCKEEKAFIFMDVATRWNSTFLMLDRAIKYREAFDLLKEEDGFYVQYFSEEDKNKKTLMGPPTSSDWDKCAIFCKFLKVFYEATLKFSASLFVTANSYFHEVCTIRGRILKWCESDISIMKDMASSMKKKYDMYWGSIKKQNVLLYVAIVLDPRYKLKYVKSCLNKIYNVDEVNIIINSVNICLSKLVSHYSKVFTLKNIDGSRCSIPMNEKGSWVDLDDDADDFNMFETEFEKECGEEEAVDMTNELDRYLAEKHDALRKNKNFKILEWWKVSSTTYPILSMMARDVLAIQVSTVASESAFSTGGRVLDSFRSSLNPTTVEALICCQNWLTSSSLPLDMGSLLEDLEAYQDADCLGAKKYYRS